MAMNRAQRINIIERWMRLLYADYLRYARESGLAWGAKVPLTVRTRVDALVDEQDELLKTMALALDALGYAEPMLGYPEDVAYLNYVHVTVVFQRAMNRYLAMLEPLQQDLEMVTQAGEFELADLCEAFVALLKKEVETLRPLCESPEQLSPR